SLGLAGCDRVVVVLGHGADTIRAEVEAAYDGPADLRFVVNDQYHLSNGLSVLAARPEVEGEFVLTMADHVLSADGMRLAAAPPCAWTTTWPASSTSTTRRRCWRRTGGSSPSASRSQRTTASTPASSSAPTG